MRCISWLVCSLGLVNFPGKIDAGFPFLGQTFEQTGRLVADGVMTVLDTAVSGITETVSESNPTEPHGEDGGKLFLGVIKSYMEYETAQVDKGNDNRPKAVFYDDLGWFYRNGSLSNLDRLPASPNQIQTKFLLYTSPDQLTAEVLDYKDAASIQRSGFNPALPSVVVIHGFKTSSGTASLQWVMLFIDALFRRQGPGNYIVVDWSKGAQAPNYWAAAANTQLVGAQLANLIQLLCQVKQTNPSMFQLIGFSLGSHVSGFAGKRLNAANGGIKLGRIFGMDAAGPLFEHAGPGGRLAKGDANIVVAEHGSADGIKNGGLGIWQQIGDVDFYANGGKEQPGCGPVFAKALENILKFDFKSVPEAIQCNHNRNWLYVLQTFDPTCQFHSIPCDTYSNAILGRCIRTFPVEPNQSMGFYFQNSPTNSKMFFHTNAPSRDLSCGYHIKVTILAAKASTHGRGTFSVMFVDAKGNETTPYIIAHDGRLPAGKQAFLLVRSSIAPAAIKRVKILYHRFCQPDTCFADTVNIQSVTLATVANDVVKTSCQGIDMVSDMWVSLGLRDGKCKTGFRFG
ncbi:putative Hepatic triacylglycerol lipase [Hypsibius exemplaris]|uniref:Hepatic triacylglycerol lipase n=1 Tax=Hypsibius exemplaris TaxID=2072580 RepID=A0A1W0WWV2_HYPEX|nr:putative Hepatic triacylglycerol lipase [Hypsibius exemplaris]